MKDKIIELIELWKTDLEISKELDINRSTVYRARKKQSDITDTQSLDEDTCNTFVLSNDKPLEDITEPKKKTTTKKTSVVWVHPEHIKMFEDLFWKWFVIDPNWMKIDKFSSWIVSLDWILWWWFPVGRIIEIFWQESSW